MSTDLHRNLRRHFERHAGEAVLAAYLFGSRSRGTAGRESDIDVGVVLDPQRRFDAAFSFDLRIRLIAELVHTLGENEVDVVILNEVPPPLAAKIVREGVRVFAVQQPRLRAFERDVQLRAADLIPFLRRMRQLQLERLVR